MSKIIVISFLLCLTSFMSGCYNNEKHIFYGHEGIRNNEKVIVYDKKSSEDVASSICASKGYIITSYRCANYIDKGYCEKDGQLYYECKNEWHGEGLYSGYIYTY